MIDAQPLCSRHFVGFMPNPGQSIGIDPPNLWDEVSSIEGGKWAFLHNGSVVGAGGLMPIWDGRAMAWMIMDAKSGPSMVALTRFLPKFIDSQGFGRVEMWVAAGFDLGFRWAKQLGFELETPNPMKRYLADGGDAFLFSRCV